MSDATSAATSAATLALVRQCQDTERAAQGALAWFRDFPDRVAAQRPVLEKEFRLAAVEARKLRLAAERPVAVGVYGLSQAGKSYLISTLARAPGRALMAELDHPRGFLSDINPESDKEATGLVTRFTMRGEKGPDGFPVRLRLLSEVDLVKILANSWFCDALDAERASAGLVEAIAEVLGAAERDAVGQPENNEVRQEDIWDLSKYCDNEFRGYADAQAIRSGTFWDRMAAVLPRLALERRIDVYAVLWNRFAPFTDVLTRLTARLKTLRFDRDAWAPITALVPKTESVLKVDTLDHLADTGQLHIESTAQIEITAQNGARCTLTRPELTGLIAELQITMSELPWEIFKSTDLLDFPGARERTGKDHALEIGARPTMLGEFFLRGKVAYLFERYAAERELNALLLCIKESNNAYDATIRQSIRNWINRTHGATPEGRSRVETALFIMLTRMDMHFNRTPGRDDTMASDDLWEARVKASLLQPLQEANGWLDNWHPGRPFDNTLLARNPGKSQSLSRLSEAGVEQDYLPGVPEKIERWGREFAANPGIRRHLRQPERAWNEVFKLNDAGMTFLVDSLGPVCRPELKLNQLTNQVAILRADMKRRLSEWHVGDDLDAEYNKRLEALKPALELLEANGNAGRFGLLLTQFHLTPAEAREVLLRTLPTAEASRAAPPAATGAVSSMRDRLRARSAPASAAPPDSAAGDEPTQDRAAALLSAWIAKLRRFPTETSLHGFFGFDGPAADALVAEMTATASRCRLQSRLVEGLGRIKGGLRFDQAADRRAVLVSQLVNEHVNFLGMSLDGKLAPDRPRVEGGPPAFEPTKPPQPGFEIEDEPEPFGPLFVLSWVDVLADAVKRNVFDQGGAGMVDQKQNEALGNVLALL